MKTPQEIAQKREAFAKLVIDVTGKRNPEELLGERVELLRREGFTKEDMVSLFTGLCMPYNSKSYQLLPLAIAKSSPLVAEWLYQQLEALQPFLGDKILFGRSSNQTTLHLAIQNPQPKEMYQWLKRKIIDKKYPGDTEDKKVGLEHWRKLLRVQNDAGQDAVEMAFNLARGPNDFEIFTDMKITLVHDHPDGVMIPDGVVPSLEYVIREQRPVAEERVKKIDSIAPYLFFDSYPLFDMNTPLESFVSPVYATPNLRGVLYFCRQEMAVLDRVLSTMLAYFEKNNINFLSLKMESFRHNLEFDVTHSYLELEKDNMLLRFIIDKAIAYSVDPDHPYFYFSVWAVHFISHARDIDLPEGSRLEQNFKDLKRKVLYNFMAMILEPSNVSYDAILNYFIHYEREENGESLTADLLSMISCIYRKKYDELGRLLPASAQRKKVALGLPWYNEWYAEKWWIKGICCLNGYGCSKDHKVALDIFEKSIDAFSRHQALTLESHRFYRLMWAAFKKIDKGSVDENAYNHLHVFLLCMNKRYADMFPLFEQFKELREDSRSRNCLSEAYLKTKQLDAAVQLKCGNALLARGKQLFAEGNVLEAARSYLEAYQTQWTPISSKELEENLSQCIKGHESDIEFAGCCAKAKALEYAKGDLGDFDCRLQLKALANITLYAKFCLACCVFGFGCEKPLSYFWFQNEKDVAGLFLEILETIQRVNNGERIPSCPPKVAQDCLEKMRQIPNLYPDVVTQLVAVQGMRPSGVASLDDARAVDLLGDGEESQDEEESQFVGQDHRL